MDPRNTDSYDNLVSAPASEVTNASEKFATVKRVTLYIPLVSFDFFSLSDARSLDINFANDMKETLV